MKTSFIAIGLVLMALTVQSSALSVFTTLEASSNTDKIHFYKEAANPDTEYYDCPDLKNGELIEIIGIPTNEVIDISTIYGKVGQIRASDLTPDFYATIKTRIDSLPPDEKSIGVATKATRKTIKEISGIANRLFTREKDDLLYYLRKWNFMSEKYWEAEIKNRKLNITERDLSYPCDEITVCTPYCSALMDCWNKKKNFSEPNEAELYKCFSKPITVAIQGAFYVGAIDGGRYKSGAIVVGDKIIKPFRQELEKIADTSSSWPEYPAYKATNTYYFEWSKIMSNKQIEFITNDTPPLVFKIDLNKIR
jgi:hypothetical protein